MRACFLTPSLKGSDVTLGCWRSAHTLTFRPASLVQSTRDCCPAPTPTICPFIAYPTEFDCVYLSAMEDSTMSRWTDSGRELSPPSPALPSAPAAVLPADPTGPDRWSRVSAMWLRRCMKPMPNTSRNSTLGPSYAMSASRQMNLPFFFFARISRASGSNPGATMPSQTQNFRTLAVATSTTSLTAAKSPNDDMGSALRART
mmetsp:Transcript_98716/g.240128  ORF Transcript_98716/g.240128 Transcript_98716/m.240128 type:complete len:202 (-) Transcript_98716:49-654(-)